MFYRICLSVLIFVVSTPVMAQRSDLVNTGFDTTMKRTAIADLKAILHAEERWIKVHAAEFLIWENQLIEEVRDEFLKENERYSEVPQYRIGIWRVLAQASATQHERKQWEDRIVTAYMDKDGPDRLHAIETLAKLRHVVMETGFLDEIAEVPVTPYSLYQLWNLSYHPEVSRDAVIERLLSHMEQNIGNEHGSVNMLVSSYILRSFGRLPYEFWERLYEISDQNQAGLQASILATLWMTQPVSAPFDMVDGIRSNLSLSAAERAGVNHVLMALASYSNMGDIVEIQGIFERLRDRQAVGYDADLHASAAYAMLSYINAKFEKADVE